MKTKAAPWQKMKTNLKLGLRTLDEKNWLPFEDFFGNTAARSHQLATKFDLFNSRYEEVFATLPSANAASNEVLEMVEAHLHAYHPKYSRNTELSLHPLETAARLIPEDLLLIEPRQSKSNKSSYQPEWCLAAGALCFPAHWKLKEKMDKALAIIHKPVPDYEKILANPVNRLFTNMRIGPISTRVNWSLQFGDALFMPVRSHAKKQTACKAGGQIYVRIENQTLRKLPKTGHVLFTIRTHLAPVTNWSKSSGAIEELLFLLENMPNKMRRYKGADIYEKSLRKILADNQYNV